MCPPEKEPFGHLSSEFPLNLIKEMENSLTTMLDREVVRTLFEDKPSTRRRIYLELAGINNREFLYMLQKAGFDMASLRLAPINMASVGFSCLVTGTTPAILKFLHNNQSVQQVSIDFPEYSRLSATPINE